MSDSIPFFNMANLTNSMTNSSFPSNMNFGFSFGNLDPNFSLSLKPQNQAQGQNSNRDGIRNKENHNQKKNKKGNIKQNNQQGDDNGGLEEGLNHDDENEDSQNGQVCKASRKIRKRTLEKLKKKSEKESFNENPRNPFVVNPKNRNNKMALNKFAPGAALNPMMFHKTKICPHFIEGACKRGENCNYAHSQNELKEVPNLKKTKMCQLFQNGRCNMGNLCSFAHGDQELRSTSEFYKTSMCNSYLKGTCRMGDKCRYAHGQDELRRAAVSSASIFPKEKDPAPVQSNSNMSNFSTNPFNVAEPVSNISLPKNDNALSGFVLPVLNPPTLQTNTVNTVAFSNLPTSFSGFSFGTSTNKTNNTDPFGTSNIFAQAATNVVPGNKSVEKKPATQTSITDGIAFNTFNPDMLASIFNPNANKNFFG